MQVPRTSEARGTWDHQAWVGCHGTPHLRGGLGVLPIKVLAVDGGPGQAVTETPITWGA